MSQAIAIDELPRKAERLLRVAWEMQESIVLERHGEPLAAVVPMEEYRRWHTGGKKVGNGGGTTAEPTALPLAYELPADLLADYDRLLNKKFEVGLTPGEEAEFARLAQSLSDADMATPLGQAIMSQARQKHERWMRTLNEVEALQAELAVAIPFIPAQEE